jgi:hypothetical protein
MVSVNLLNAELNPICHLLALLGGAIIVVVSRLRVKHGSRSVANPDPGVRPHRIVLTLGMTSWQGVMPTTKPNIKSKISVNMTSNHPETRTEFTPATYYVTASTYFQPQRVIMRWENINIWKYGGKNIYNFFNVK